MIDDGFDIFVNSLFFGDIDWEEKDDVISQVTDFFKSVIKNYPINLEGFYKVSVYPSNVGILMKVTLIDDYGYNDKNLDFRIVVYLNKDIYFRTSNYDVISRYSSIFCDNDYFYILIDDIDNDFIKLCEFGDIVIDNGDLLIRTLKKD